MNNKSYFIILVVIITLLGLTNCRNVDVKYWAEKNCQNVGSTRKFFSSLAGGYILCSEKSCPQDSLGIYKTSLCHLCCYANKTETIVKYVTQAPVSVDHSVPVYYEISIPAAIILFTICIGLGVAVCRCWCKMKRIKRQVNISMVTLNDTQQQTRNDQISAEPYHSFVLQTENRDSAPQQHPKGFLSQPDSRGDYTQSSDNNTIPLSLPTTSTAL